MKRLQIVILSQICIFLISCSNIFDPYSSEEDGHYLRIDAPSLSYSEDDSNYYMLYFLPDYIQTFTTLRAQTNIEYEKVQWISNKEILISGIWTNLINGSSYTDNDGVAYGVLGVWEDFIGDTVTVYCGYYYDGTLLMDSLNVIVAEIQ